MVSNAPPAFVAQRAALPELNAEEVARVEGSPREEARALAREEYQVQTGVRNVNGRYTRVDENHGRGVYRMQEGGSDAEGAVKPVIYYWDDRDGETSKGWWIGTDVGGTQVWAHNNSDAMTPPEINWRIPYSGYIDPEASVRSVGGQLMPVAAAIDGNVRRDLQQYFGVEAFQVQHGDVLEVLATLGLERQREVARLLASSPPPEDKREFALMMITAYWGLLDEQ
jgi:hypothetical protein